MPRKKKLPLSVGNRISCPGRVFAEPGKAYPGTVIGIRGDKADIRFDEDGSKYWFPVADAAGWVVKGAAPAAALAPASASPARRGPGRPRKGAPASPSPSPSPSTQRGGGPGARLMVHRRANRSSPGPEEAPAPARATRASGTAAAVPMQRRGPGRPPKAGSASAAATASAAAPTPRPLAPPRSTMKKRAAARAPLRLRLGSYVSDSAALGLMGAGLAAAATAASWWLLRVAAPGPVGVPLA